MLINRCGVCEHCGIENVLVIKTQSKIVEARYNTWEFMTVCLKCLDEDIVRARRIYLSGQSNIPLRHPEKYHGQSLGSNN